MNKKIEWDKIPDWNDLVSCNDPSHNFPSHLWIPPGQSHTHKCPRCGQETTVTAPIITC
jgi:hypothetical protein